MFVEKREIINCKTFFNQISNSKRISFKLIKEFINNMKNIENISDFRHILFYLCQKGDKNINICKREKRGIE